MDRMKISSESKWEPIVGYSRAVRVSNHVLVAGTTAPGAGAYEQSAAVLAKIEAALLKAGASRVDVVRTRIYAADIARDWEEIGRAHREFFGETMPVCTMVQVTLVDPALLVEIEADAIVTGI